MYSHVGQGEQSAFYCNVNEKLLENSKSENDVKFTLLFVCFLKFLFYF